MKYLLILLLILTTLIADDDNHYNKHNNERHINKELSHLNLSKKQKKQIKYILKDYRDDLKDFREYKEDIEKKRESLFLKDTLDIKELDRLNNSLDAVSHEIENQFLKNVHSILSEKQRRKFIYYLDDWKVR